MGLVPHGLEGGKAAADHVIRDAVADPEVFLAAKAGAGDDEEVLFLRQVREDVGVAIGSLDEEIERAVGLGHRIAHFRQLIIEQRAVFIVRLRTIEQLAQEVGLSPTALKSCFKGIYGSSVYAYQKEYRLQLAQKLLLETDCTVAEIAHRVGYENPNKFSSAFREAAGMTPTEYRKMRPIG